MMFESIKSTAAAVIMTLGLAACASAPATTQAPPVTPTTPPATAITQTGGDVPEVATEIATDSAPAETCQWLNLNTVTEDQLKATIPAFPNRMVREFFEYRPYISIQQFRREIGKYVDQTQVADWEQYVYVPVDANLSDEDTLMQIPGVDATVAAALVSARPYASNQAFVDTLSGHIGADQAAQATCFLAQ
jgi:hypothetical protein